MKYFAFRWALWAFAAVVLFAPSAEANFMVPMLAGAWLAMIPLLIPIVLIESAVLIQAGASVWVSFLAVSVANLASTLAGFPLSLIIDGVTGVTDKSETGFGRLTGNWRVPVNGVLLLVPFFLLSWWIESAIVTRIVGDLPYWAVEKAVWDGNLATYALIGLLVAALLLINIWDFINFELAAAWHRLTKSPPKWVRPKESAINAPSWKVTNDSGKRGIAKLKFAEERIAKQHPILLVSQSKETPAATNQNLLEPDLYSVAKAPNVSKVG